MMDKWLSDGEIAEHEGFLSHAEEDETVKVIERMAVQAREANRLRAGLEAAYREGWSTGYGSGLGDGHPLNWPECDEDQDWEGSDARKLLEGEK